jgi:hypothetical protein
LQSSISVITLYQAHIILIMPKLTFLFWNIQKNNLDTQITQLCKLHDVDILLIAEFGDNKSIFLESSLQNIHDDYHYINPLTKPRVELFVKSSCSFVEQVRDTPHTSIRKINIIPSKQITLVGLHLPSKRNMTDVDQMAYQTTIMNLINEEEQKIGHTNTLVIGDFNMHPFQMVSAGNFHATMDKNIALKQTREVHKKLYRYFYNPMWNFLGDNNKSKVAGTYYNNAGAYTNYYWNMFDQVLLRPDLLANFDENSLEIITSNGATSYIKKGIINTQYSDHLPIKFTLNF